MPNRRKLIITVACLLGLAGANVLAAWCLPEQWDWTRQGDFTLSLESRQLLQNLDQPVEITIFLAPKTARTHGDAHFEKARLLLDDLLERYRQASPLVTIRELDPSVSAEMQQFQQRFSDVSSTCVVITYGSGTSLRHEVLSPRELLENRTGTEHQAGSIKFLGEQAITAALKRLSAGRKQTVIYVLEGHGELSLSRSDPTAWQGLTRLAERLRELDCELRPLDLKIADGVPADAHLVLLAGPEQPFSTAEIQKFTAWLSSGGKAILLFDYALDPRTNTVVRLGWENLLDEYGLGLGDDRILTRVIGDRVETASLGRATSADHPLVRALPTTSINLFGCRTVRKTNSVRQRPVVLTALLATSKNPLVWAEGDTLLLNPQPGGKTDLESPVAMAFAVERLVGGQGGKPEPALVVIGDAEFVSNKSLADSSSESGFQLILSSINWLRGRHELLADIRPHVRSAYRLPGDAVAHRRLVWLPGLFFAATLVTAGTTVWFIRRQG